MHYLEIIEVAANYLSYLNFDLFSRMSTQKPFEGNFRGFLRLATLDSHRIRYQLGLKSHITGRDVSHSTLIRTWISSIKSENYLKTNSWLIINEKIRFTVNTVSFWTDRKISLLEVS